uniref:Protein kinase domain-containing protein n=1 Tax=Globodera pallida TaxID=36090 RepID=A0A183BZ98_GLOPA
MSRKLYSFRTSQLVEDKLEKFTLAIQKLLINLIVQIFLNGIKIWDKLQREVPSEKRQYIVQLIDYGKIGWNKYLATMEMGGAQTFYDCLKDGCFGDKSVEELAREMVKPLKEIHQVAVHLDYKPSNLVYVMDINTQKRLLKLIDFDSAVPIPSVNIWQGRANICEQPSPYAMITPTYICPEFYKANLVSTKADMWAFGISVYELLLNQPMYRGVIEDVDSLIDNIAEIHRGFSIVKSEQFLIDFISDDWLEEPRYAEAIFHIIQIWTDFPQIALLVMNVLDTDIVTRMTAIGVLNYLDGKWVHF